MADRHRPVIGGASQSAHRARDGSHRFVGGLLGVVALVGCADAGGGDDGSGGGGFDYQLGGAYEPADDVGVVARDRTADPDPDRYSICYVNGFQTQPDEAAFWLDEHPDLLVRDADGVPVIDPEWPDEWVLDISSPAKRDALVSIVGTWIDGCAADGFDGVEIDNLDTFERFPDRIGEADAVAVARALADRAHAADLEIGQKNAAGLVARRDDTGFDFAVVEQCNEFDECDVFTDGYGERVYVIEYDESAFERGCERHPDLSIVLRDVDLVGPGDPSYVRRTC